VRTDRKMINICPLGKWFAFSQVLDGAKGLKPIATALGWNGRNGFFRWYNAKFERADIA
jgi:hypothetical protein